MALRPLSCIRMPQGYVRLPERRGAWLMHGDYMLHARRAAVRDSSGEGLALMTHCR